MPLIVSFLSLSILSCAMYHHIMLAAERRKYTPPGKRFEVDGHNMHIYGCGRGSPTVVMTCGSGTPSAYTEYSHILRVLSGRTRACVYERPGYGWSDFTTTPRDTEQIVCDLHSLLKKSGEEAPYLFVAHSMGAMEALLYAHRYPDEVKGIVLIDGTSPYKHMKYPKTSIPVIIMHMLKALNWLGLLRLAGNLGNH